MQLQLRHKQVVYFSKGFICNFEIIDISRKYMQHKWEVGKLQMMLVVLWCISLVHVP